MKRKKYDYVRHAMRWDDNPYPPIAAEKVRRVLRKLVREAVERTIDHYRYEDGEADPDRIAKELIP